MMYNSDMECDLTDTALKALRTLDNSSEILDVISLSDNASTESIDPGELPPSYIDFNNLTKPPVDDKNPATSERLCSIMENSLINQPEFFSNQAPLNPLHSGKELKKMRKQQKNDNAGKNWFNMKATEFTDEDKLDRELLKMRELIYPGQFIKKGALKDIDEAKFVQVGTWQDSPLDFYTKRKIKKKKSMVETLLADADFKKRNKAKFLKIQIANNRVSYRKDVAKRKLSALAGKKTKGTVNTSARVPPQTKPLL
jgi:hypothetical protein